ncbi:uncharacterized protein NECHADRAFT_77334 [Fusarium vanettenii 77-13-4]|uniref:Ubiquitin-like domain-containing protein n=1 Tax=Fusarium vanettenii (strain ATCC MYA-4622 / CBS 123669 / FGSC 9596 / NRRL 45880 / 77-13-4) TaxID=660122 RepID=C7YKY1_FUSV7|nr:uncharacterized protein NECHADRAFT_77334 [Fusarium vanettenii 77-13-4]EEU47156.1 hypothetical protein NECHADRAFT_77334 [Fusarium vanettenii 77-13-4]
MEAPDKIVGPFTQWNPDIQRSDTIKLDDLEITFNRFTPAAGGSSRDDMPPSIGSFPLFNASDHTAKVAQRGDRVITMSQREAMSVSFSSQKEYTIKIYSGSVNAISGELTVDTTEPPLHRLNLIQGGSFAQNYTLVLPPGCESQDAGHDTMGMLRFEISRLDRSPTESYEGRFKSPRYAIKLHGLFSNVFFSVHDGTPITDLIFTLRTAGCKSRDNRDNMTPTYTIRHNGKFLGPDDTLGDHKVQDGDTIYASTDRHRIVGLSGYPEYGDSAREMNTVAFDIHILNKTHTHFPLSIHTIFKTPLAHHKNIARKLLKTAQDLTQWDPKIPLSDTIKLDGLEITFHRTVRLPDNFDENKLPPSLGQFPLFNVGEYAAKLPSVMAQKGGLFFPMFQREAMWIGFSSQKKYAVKIYSGNVNVISGETAVETANTSLHRSRLLKKGKTI